MSTIHALCDRLPLTDSQLALLTADVFLTGFGRLLALAVEMHEFTFRTDAGQRTIRASSLDEAADRFASAEGYQAGEGMDGLIETIQGTEGAWLRVWCGDDDVALVVAKAQPKLPALVVPDITWHVPPERAGQTVEVAYGDSLDGTLWRRIYDRGDDTTEYATADASDCGCESECSCFEPWNREPTAFDWQPV